MSKERYFGITRPVTRDSERRNFDFKPPFESATARRRRLANERTVLECCSTSGEMMRGMLKSLFISVADKKHKRNADIWVKQSMLALKKLGVKLDDSRS